MNPNCGWCKKSDPVVDELKKAGFDITTLDVSNSDDAKRANEIKTKHNAQCGTPQFIDADTGNTVCGFREKDVLEKWASGEKIPLPPSPPPRPAQQRPPAQPQVPVNPLADAIARAEFKLQVWQEAKQILTEKFYNEFEIWSNWQFNDHLNGDCPIKKRPIFPTNKNIKTESEKILEFIQ
tara:strand:- start:543 stop:1082 length:540 start_codon:yes stop_codon:yes gene_type:complete